MPEDSPLGKQIRHEFATANSFTHVCLPYTLARRNTVTYMWILFSSKRMYTKTQSHLAAYLAKELLKTKQSDIRVYLL